LISTDLGDTELAALLFPEMNRTLVNAGFPRKLGDRHAGFYAAQDRGDRFGGNGVCGPWEPPLLEPIIRLEPVVPLE